ncbi:MAG TPA: hypothetical protein VNU97_10275 [Rhizomicrobium sp.]|jgi:hypothetical protein|nr:hypothetical protein [Rhizomicrobium sp.]
MKSRLRFAAAVVAASLFGMAAPLAANPAFVSDPSKDYFGYFLPTAPVKLGNWQVKDFFVGGKDDFKSFESGKADKAFGAVMLEFDDVTSPQKTAEDGQPYYTGQIRVLPTAYHVGMDRVTFAGSDEKLGAVSFVGTFDKDYFKKPSADVAHPGDRPMLRGRLTVGKQSFNVAFNWFGGD